MTEEDRSKNSLLFQECLSELLIRRLTEPPKSQTRNRKRRKNSISSEQTSSANASSDDAGNLTDFVEDLSEEIFQSLPPELQDITYAAIRKDQDLIEKYDTPLSKTTIERIVSTLPPTVTDSLVAYNLSTDHEKLIAPLLNSYIAAATEPPPSSKTLVRASACEICDRDHIPLTYHHLIPKDVHEKVLKRGWHEEWRLNSVAWLCRACHSKVHSVASTEELAREYYTVEKLMEREDIRRFAAWAGKIRWKAK